MRRQQFDLSSQMLDAKTRSHADCVVLVTDHDAFNYELIAEQAGLIVDSRGESQPKCATWSEPEA